LVALARSEAPRVSGQPPVTPIGSPSATRATGGAG
jgi:hypothetical protein